VRTFRRASGFLVLVARRYSLLCDRIWQDQQVKNLWRTASDRPWGNIRKVSHVALPCRSARGLAKREGPTSRDSSNNKNQTAQIRDVDMSDGKKEPLELLRACFQCGRKSCSKLQRLLLRPARYKIQQRIHERFLSANTPKYLLHSYVLDLSLFSSSAWLQLQRQTPVGRNKMVNNHQEEGADSNSSSFVKKN
jgi:hypothetical protein